MSDTTVSIQHLSPEVISARAERILTDTVFQAALQRSRDRIVHQLLQTSPDELDRRESLYYEARALGVVQREIRAMKDAALKHLNRT